MSRLMMIFALNIVNLFIAVYLYTLGYSLIFITLFFASVILFRAVFLPFAAKYVAYAGPKHGTLVANLLRIPSLVAILFVPQLGIGAIVVYGVFQQMAAGLYTISYLVNFSKVRNLEHSGKELGTMQMLEKAARVISPVIGGILATMYGPVVVIIIAGALFLVSSVPLLRTMEPTKTRSRIAIAGFPWRLTAPSMVAELAIGYDLVASGVVWVLFMAIVIFSGAGTEVYADLGWLVSVGVLASMFASWFFGKIVDRRQGDVLYTVGALGNAVIHLFRIFANSPAYVAGINIANETMSSAYALPFMRGIFEVADLSGHRILYMTIIQIFEALGSAAACLIFAGLLWLFGQENGFVFFFVTAAACELLLLAFRRYTK